MMVDDPELSKIMLDAHVEGERTVIQTMRSMVNHMRGMNSQESQYSADAIEAIIVIVQKVHNL